MYLDPGQTFRELIVRVAEECKCASYDAGVAAPPTDQHALDKVKRRINDAISLVGLANPRWKVLRRKVDINVSVDGTGVQNLAGDPTLYALPPGMRGGFTKPWTWTAPGITAWGGRAEDTTTERIRNLLSHDLLKGRPQLVAIEPYRPRSGQGVSGNVWMLLLYPRPDRAYVLTNSGRAVPTRLIEDDDRHVFGADFDQVIVAGAAAKYHQGTKRYAEDWALFQGLIVQAKAMDAQTGADTVGQMSDGDDLYIDPAIATRMAPVLIDGVDVNR